MGLSFSRCVEELKRNDDTIKLAELLKDIDSVGLLNFTGEHRNALKSTLLHVASNWGKVAAAKYLIEKCKDLVNAKDEYFFTPLHLAVIYGHEEIVNLLLDNGANVNEVECGSSPLHWAIEKSDEGLVGTLLRRGANVKVENHKGESAISFAKSKGNSSVILLVTKDEPIELKEKESSTESLTESSAESHSDYSTEH